MLGNTNRSLLTGALAVALGVTTWLLSPILLPVKVPDDFPKPKLELLILLPET